MTRSIIVPLKPGSDADATHRPKSSAYTLEDPPTNYLEKLARLWMSDRNEAQDGVTYNLARLPPGYALYSKPRPTNSKQVDKWLYGHPEHKTFDSPNRFYPHFLYLMDNNGSNIGCPCAVCNRGSSAPKARGRPGNSRASSDSRSSFFSRPSSGHEARKFQLAHLGQSAQSSTFPDAIPPTTAGMGSSDKPISQESPRRDRPKLVDIGYDSSNVDEEGTPDVYRNLISKLEQHGNLDEAIREPMSADWRAEQKILPKLLLQSKQEPQWLPRTGEIVLFDRTLPLPARSSQMSNVNNTEDHIHRWEAGLIGESGIGDMSSAMEDNLCISTAGVRVEPLPDPNSSNKSLSKGYTYLPLRNTRPFYLLDSLLAHTPECQWHPTIKNALTSMLTVSLIDKHRFRGNWPEAQIYCSGIFIGAEKLMVGDTVRLLPKKSQFFITDVLVITSIRLKLSHLDHASKNDYDDGQRYRSYAVVHGTQYTTEPLRACPDTPNPVTIKAGTGYGPWFAVLPPSRELRVPFWRVMGRLHEYNAASPEDINPNLDLGRISLSQARGFARAHDQRLDPNQKQTWFWGDTRVEALDLHTVNGLDVGKHDAEHDARALRKKIKIVDDGASGGPAARPYVSVKNLRGFMAPASVSGADPSTASRQQHVDVDTTGSLEDEDDQLYILKHTKLLDPNDPNSPRPKGTRVMVVID